MLMLPQILNGIAIPAAASLLDASAAQQTQNGSKKNAFSSLLKSELNNPANSSNDVKAAKKPADQTNEAGGATQRLEERLKKLAAEINKAAHAEIDKTKDSLTASVAGSATTGNFFTAMNQTNPIKADAAQIQKLQTTGTVPSAPAPEADSHTKLFGDNTSVVLITGKEKANNTILDRYRMETVAMNKKGLSGSNVMVGLRIPIG